MAYRAKRGAFGLFAVLTALALTVTALALVSAGSARAQSGNVYPDMPVNFGGVSGQSEAVAVFGDQLWVGGTFTQAIDADQATTHPRSNLAAFDFDTGDVLPLTFDTDGIVRSITTDNATTVWVAGDFTQIDGRSRTYLAAINPFSGELAADFSVTLDYELFDIEYHDGWLYLGGAFVEVNGSYYQGLARVDPETGELDTDFRPQAKGRVFAIDVYGDRVYAAGNFEELGDAPDIYDLPWMVAVDIATGIPTGPQYQFPPLQPGEAGHKAGVSALHVSPDGQFVYTGDHRNDLTQWELATATKNWAFETEGDVQIIEMEGDTVYGGTHDGLYDNGDGRLLFAMDTQTGLPDDSFAPLLNDFNGAIDMTVSQGSLVVAGEFTELTGVPASYLGVFRGPAWTGATPIPFPTVVGDVSCDAELDIFDALMIAQYSVGLRTAEATCPLSDPATTIGPGGDLNNDGFVDVIDALLVAQCDVGLPNVACPA